MTKNGMRPINPGEVLREEFLVPLGITAHALSLKLHVSAPTINNIVREQRAVTSETALRLGRFFHTTPEFWLNLQLAYDLRKAELTVMKDVEREVEPMAA